MERMRGNAIICPEVRLGLPEVRLRSLGYGILQPSGHETYKEFVKIELGSTFRTRASAPRDSRFGKKLSIPGNAVFSAQVHERNGNIKLWKRALCPQRICHTGIKRVRNTAELPNCGTAELKSKTGGYSGLASSGFALRSLSAAW
jgi:hypothetical protein